MKKRKIAYVTGTRADFGLINPILKRIKKSKFLDLSLYITGMHLMSKFGKTVEEIEKEYPESIRLNAIFKGNNEVATANFNQKLIRGLISQYEKNRPDLMLVLGDRSEMMTAALTCISMGIPVGHIHGGDVTGTKDEIFRHAITKLSQLHFCTTTGAAKRIALMGEEKWRIYQVGAPGIDVILNEKLPSRKELYQYLKLDFNKEYILVLQHPVSEEIGDSGKHMEETIEAVKSFNLPVIVIYPNADAGRDEMIDIIEKEKKNPNFRIYRNLEHRLFLSLEKEAIVWVGNSSAGIIESASFKTPVVDIGTRQLGRERSINVIKANYDRKSIIRAIKKCLFDVSFRKKLENCVNCWGDGKAALRIIDVLENIEINEHLMWKKLKY